MNVLMILLYSLYWMTWTTHMSEQNLNLIRGKIGKLAGMVKKTLWKAMLWVMRLQLPHAWANFVVAQVAVMLIFQKTSDSAVITHSEEFCLNKLNRLLDSLNESYCIYCSYIAVLIIWFFFFFWFFDFRKRVESAIWLNQMLKF